MKRKTNFEGVTRSEDITASSAVTRSEDITASSAVTRSEDITARVSSAVASPTLPVLDSIKGLTNPQKQELSGSLIMSGYADPVVALARLGSRAFDVLNGIYKNIIGPCSVGGDKGFPLLEAYQKACEYAKKLEANQTVCGKKGKGEVK